MSASENNHSIKGTWRGQYFYSHAPGEGHGFEAVFVEMDGIIEGNILDEEFPVEAFVGGTFRYPNVQFVKIYRGRHGVEYSGTMNEQGTELHGRWIIRGDAFGTWVAFRGNPEDDLKFHPPVDVKLDVETETPVAPLKVQ